MNDSRGKRSGRIASIAAVAVASIAAFASLGGVGLAQSAVGLAQYQYGKKVTICHKGKRTIRVSVRAWPAHKRHGDAVGTCDQAERSAHAKKLHAKKLHAKKLHAKKLHAKVVKTHGKKAEHETDAVSETVGRDSGHGASNKSNGKGKGHNR